MSETIRISNGSPGIIVIEAVETTDVGTGESDALLGRVELNRRDETTAATGVDVLPIARGADGRCRRQDESGASHFEVYSSVWSLQSLKNVWNLEWTSQVEENVVDRKGTSINTNVGKEASTDRTGDARVNNFNQGLVNYLHSTRICLPSLSAGILLLVSGLSDRVAGGGGGIEGRCNVNCVLSGTNI